MKETTSHNVLGFWFHITWDNEKVGHDQRGVEWNNKSNPVCTDKALIDVCLDNYDTIIKSKF